MARIKYGKAKRTASCGDVAAKNIPPHKRRLTAAEKRDLILRCGGCVLPFPKDKE
jgi:hypothetical protein